jgi:hypothetical protein
VRASLTPCQPSGRSGSVRPRVAPKTLKTHSITTVHDSSNSKNEQRSLKKVIVLSHFFHFLLAFHRQFVLLFLNEEFLEGDAAGQDSKFAPAAVLARHSENRRRVPKQRLLSKSEGPFGSVMQRQMNPIWISGYGKVSDAAGLFGSIRLATSRGISAISRHYQVHHRQSSSTTFSQPTCTYAPA